MTVRVRVHGKLKRKRVWGTRTGASASRIPASATMTPRDTPAPSVPGGVEAVAGNGRVTLVWVAGQTTSP